MRLIEAARAYVTKHQLRDTDPESLATLAIDNVELRSALLAVLEDQGEEGSR